MPERVALPAEEGPRQGLVQVYTGSGKGKTTAALGLALRAAGQGLRVCIVQFMKGIEYGELRSLANVPEVSVRQFGEARWVRPSDIREADRELARQGLEHARRQVQAGACDLLILDEVNVALAYKLLEVEAVLSLLRERPPETEVVLTGRGAPAAILEEADLVTRMVEVKHPYQRGVPARRGIEY